MKKQPELTAQTKKNITDAFWELYCNNSIEKITVKQITDKAGYNRSTFYEYFSDVHHVLYELEQSLIPSLNELPPISTSMGDFGMPIETFLDLFSKNQAYYSVLLGQNGDPAFAAQIKNTIKPVIYSKLKNNTKLDAQELDYILEYTLSAMIGVMVYWFSEKNPPSSKKLVAIIQRIMENGITALF